MADFKYFGANYIYVDAGIGNDANAGTIALPKRTVLAAINIASNNDTIIVGTGMYDYIEPGGFNSQGVSIIGDGFVLFDGTNAGVGNCIKEVMNIKNITFYNYNEQGDNNYAVDFTTKSNNNPYEIQGCNFHFCDFLKTRNTWNYIKDCIFTNCRFDSAITSTELQGAIQNCNFLSCEGQLGDADAMTYGVFNNIYRACNTMSHTFNANQLGVKFNNNNIDSIFDGQTQDQLKSLGTNLSGSSFAITLVFNDYDVSRPLDEWWKQSFTQKLNSPLLTTGRNGTHIGRYYKSFYTNAVDIMSNVITSNNVQLSTDVIDVIVSGVAADYLGDTFNIGNEKLSRLIMNANYTYGANGEITEYIFQRDNVAPQEKSSINLGVATIDQIDATTYLPIDNYWYLGYGAAQSLAPPYIATSDTNYLAIGEEFNGKLIIKSNSVHLRFELKTL